MRVHRAWCVVLLAAAAWGTAGMSTCSNVPTEPFTLTGTWHMLSVDSASQTISDPYYTGSPQTFITGALLEVFSGDSMHITTYYTQFGTFPSLTRGTWSEQTTIRPYSQSGDSLFVDSPGGPIPLGEIVDTRLDIFMQYPVPPSQGHSSANHEFVFTK